MTPLEARPSKTFSMIRIMKIGVSITKIQRARQLCHRQASKARLRLDLRVKMKLRLTSVRSME